ncbi:MAG: sigma-70 family RNA polymerase sigma factor [Acidimicrobiia bacterium]|nr:sigma-70 family RNA polymerase sigma factor [Acidimicrobiia bacterium]
MKDLQLGGHAPRELATQTGADATPVDSTHAERVARFEAIYTEHRRAVLAYCLRRSDPDTARDAMAEAFLVAWRRLDDVPTEPRAWLIATARRTLANLRRASVRQSSLRDKMTRDPVGVPTSTPEQQALRSAEREALHLALTRLSADDRELLELAAWDDLSTSEIATVLGIPAARVSVRLHRAKRRLVRAYRAVDAAGPSQAREEGR